MCSDTHEQHESSGGGKRSGSLGSPVAIDLGGGHQLRLQDGPHPSLAHHGAGCPEGCDDGNPGTGTEDVFL